MSYAGLVFNVIKNIGLVPIYFRYFDLGTYGAWLASANIVALLGLLDLGLGTVFYQKLAEAYGARDTERFARITGSVVGITVITTPVFASLGAILSTFIPALVHADVGMHRALAVTFTLSAAAASLDLAQTNLIAISHAWQRTAIGGTARIVVQFVEVAVTLFALRKGVGIVAFGLGSVAGAVIGLSVTTAVTTHIWRGMRLPRPAVDLADLRHLSSTSLPVFFSRVAGHVASNIDVALVSAVVSPAAAAVYGLTDRLFRVALAIVNPIAGSVLSALAHLLGEVGPRGVAPPLRDLFMAWSIAAAMTFPILLAMNRDFVTMWIGVDKYGGLALSCSIALSSFLAARSFMMYIVLNGLGQVRFVAWLSVAEPAVRLPLMAAGLLFIGPVGLPLASALSAGVLSLWIYPRRVARAIELPGRPGVTLQMRGLGAAFASLTLGAALAWLAPRTSSWPALVSKAALVSAVVAAATLALSNDIREHSTRAMRTVRTRLVGRQL